MIRADIHIQQIATLTMEPPDGSDSWRALIPFPGGQITLWASNQERARNMARVLRAAAASLEETMAKLPVTPDEFEEPTVEPLIIKNGRALLEVA